MKSSSPNLQNLPWGGKKFFTTKPSGFSHPYGTNPCAEILLPPPEYTFAYKPPQTEFLQEMVDKMAKAILQQKIQAILATVGTPDEVYALPAPTHLSTVSSLYGID